MEEVTSGNVISRSSPVQRSSDHYYYKLHLNNIQLLSAIDCALAVTTLIFDCRQVILTIESLPSTDKENRSQDEEKLYTRLIIAAVVSVCLTLTQLLLACLMMLSLSKRDEVLSKRTRLISGAWILWSGILLTVLLTYAFSMKRLEDIVEKFYLFMLVFEILLRIIIIIYTTGFFVWQWRFVGTHV